MHDQMKPTLDALSFFAAIGTLASYVASILPPLAALASILWIAFQFYHSAPMKERRARKKVK